MDEKNKLLQGIYIIYSVAGFLAFILFYLLVFLNPSIFIQNQFLKTLLFTFAFAAPGIYGAIIYFLFGVSVLKTNIYSNIVLFAGIIYQIVFKISLSFFVSNPELYFLLPVEIIFYLGSLILIIMGIVKGYKLKKIETTQNKNK